VQIPTHPQSIRPQPFKNQNLTIIIVLAASKKTGKDKGGPEPNWERGGEVETDLGGGGGCGCGMLCKRERETKGEIYKTEREGMRQEKADDTACMHACTRKREPKREKERTNRIELP